MTDAKRPKKFCRAPPRFGECFRDAQYILVSFLFASRYPVHSHLYKWGAHAPVPRVLWFRRHCKSLKTWFTFDGYIGSRPQDFSAPVRTPSYVKKTRTALTKLNKW